MQTFPAKRRERFLHTLALILLAMLLAACGYTAGSTAQASSATPAPSGIATVSVSGSTPPPPTAKPPEHPSSAPLVSIRMLDKTNGWALTKNAVLKTADGGLHWHVLTTLPAMTPSGPAADFMDGTYAWVAFHEASTTQGIFKVLRTTNGGVNWQAVTIQNPTAESVYDVVSRPHFITAQEGWVTTGQGEGMYHSSMTIFHTTDGGLHWNMLANTAPQSPSGLADSGDKTGISFKDSQMGWVTADVPAIYSWLYMTSDGGKTWQEQKLAPPTEISNPDQIGDFTTTPPVLFGNDGLLPVQVYTSQPHMDLYVTHDGGKTWTPTKLAPLGINNLYIQDMQHAWSNDQQGFYTTSDGGESWTRLGPSPGQIGEMSFVSATLGWAIGASGFSTPLLLTTSDGGRTWQQVSYYIQ